MLNKICRVTTFIAPKQDLVLPTSICSQTVIFWSFFETFNECQSWP